MNNYQDTIISQFANSDILTKLIEDMNEYFDQSDTIQQFVNFILNISTAQSWGLDILGRIVGVGRVLQIPVDERYFGFMADYTPFNDAPFFSGHSSTSSYYLSDNYYRKLVAAKAIANISGCDVISINYILQIVFSGKGKCYIKDNGDRTIIYYFQFQLEPFELAMINNSGVFVHPAGTSYTIVQGY